MPILPSLWTPVRLQTFLLRPTWMFGVETIYKAERFVEQILVL